MEWLIYISLFVIGLFSYYKTTIDSSVVLIILSLSVLFVFNYQAAFTVTCLTGTTYFLQSSKEKAWLGIAIQITVLIWVNYFLKKGILFNLGLSYYGLQNIGILLISIRKAPQNISFNQILLSNIFFPKFISGPILTFKEIVNFKTDDTFAPSNIYMGINRILFGVFKKLVLADNLTVITNTVFNHPESQFKGITIAIAGLLFTIEMYLNFSAYTDIALGIARLFNIKLKENFNLPLRAFSISEYWKKTHISLIDWLTQNIFYYITFTWRKHPISSTILGILITFTLSGIWHGSAIGFLIWGLLNALYLIVDYSIKKLEINGNKIFHYLGWSLTMLAVSFANLFFRSKYYENSKKLVQQLIEPINWNFKWPEDVIAILGNGGYLEQQFNLSIVLLLISVFLLFEHKLENLSKLNKPSIIYYTVIILLIFIFGNFNAGSEFIYMQF